MINTGYKVGIVGMGNVGATIAYTLLLSGVTSELVLIDLNRDRAEGEAMDLRHGIPLCPPTDVHIGGYEDLTDADVVILTAGVGQRDGETRIQLLRRNRDVFAAIVPSIVKYAPDAILLVVTNPVDILTKVAQELSGLPPERVIGSGTVLDTSRLRYLLSQTAGIDATNIHTYVLGEHGDTEFVAWSLTTVAGMAFHNFCHDCGLEFDAAYRQAVEDEVRGAAYEIIRRKGATYYAVAVAVHRIVRAILRNEESVLTVSVGVKGRYGGLPDVCLALPCVVGGGGIDRVIEVALDQEEMKKLHHSANVLDEALTAMR